MVVISNEFRTHDIYHYVDQLAVICSHPSFLTFTVWARTAMILSCFRLSKSKARQYHGCWCTVFWRCQGITVLYISMFHYDDIIMGAIATQITSLTTVYSTGYWGVDQSKHQSSASLAFVRGIHRGPVNSPHKWPVTRKMSPFDDVIMVFGWCGLPGEWIWTTCDMSASARFV